MPTESTPAFEIVDVVCHRPLPLLELKCDSVHTVYVCKDFYDAELKKGQETFAQAEEQLSRDVGRCIFETEGHAPGVPPEPLIRYCTQASMALAVELLSHRGIIAEHAAARPMRVSATRTQVNVSKELRVFAQRRWVPIKVSMAASLGDEKVRLIFEVGDVARRIL